MRDKIAYNRAWRERKAEHCREWNRQWQRRRGDKNAAIQQDWCVNNPGASTARTRVFNAVRSGKLSKPSACSKCGDTGARIEAHHFRGYEYPLDVKWLCTRCHKRAERDGL